MPSDLAGVTNELAGFVMMLHTNWEVSSMSEHRELKVLNYLDNLNQSAVVSMFDYAEQISQEFDLSEAEAKACIRLWLKTFSQRFLEKRSAARQIQA